MSAAARSAPARRHDQRRGRRAQCGLAGKHILPPDGSEVPTEECASAEKGAPPWFKTCIAKRPGMDHVRPNFESYRHIRRTRHGGKSCGILEQRFGRSNLDKYWWQPANGSIKHGNSGIPAIHPGGDVSVGQFSEVGLVNERINRILANER